MVQKVMIEGFGTTIVGPCLDEEAKQARGESRFGVAITFDKDNTSVLEKSKRIIESVAAEAVNTVWGGRKPNDIYSCLRDGDIDRKDNTLFAHKIFVNAKTKNEPVLFDIDGKPADASAFITDTPVKAEISYYPYNYKGRIGIAVGLERLWLDSAILWAVKDEDDDDYLS